MSHHTSLTAMFQDVDVLIDAILETFPHELTRDQIEVNDNAVPMINYYGKSTHDAHVIIRRGNKLGKHYANYLFDDVGWNLDSNEQIISDYDKESRELGVKFSNSLAQRYAVGVAKKAAKKKGYRVTEKKVDGKVKLICAKGW